MHTNSRFRALTLAALTLAVTTPLGAQQAGDPLPTDPAVTIGQLDNGLRYYIRRNTRPENRAELRLVVNAGSILEDDDQLGLAHLVEHMAFNGTENFEKQELVDYLESIGMEFGPSVNAYTSFDETVYMLQVPTDDDEIVTTAFQILEDWAHRVTFEPDEIDKERGVVVEEWRLGRGAGARIRDRQFPVIFADSRYAERLPIGDPDVLRSFPHERLVAFYEAWYRPDLMAVIAVGDFDAAAIEALIRAQFSGIPTTAAPIPRPSFDVPDHAEPLYVVASDAEATSSQVAVLVKQDPAGTRTVADYRRQLIESLATGILNSRLFELGQEADPPYAGAGAARGRFVRTKSVFQLAASVRDGGVERGLGALLTEAERAARHGFTGSELEREKADLLRGLEQLYNERDNLESGRLAGQYVSHFLQDDPIPGIAFEFDAARALVPGITLDEVNAAARGALGGENRVVTVSGPAKAEADLPTEADLRTVFEAVAAAEIEPYEDVATDAPLLASPPTPGRIVEEGGIPELEVTEWQLSNGVVVWLKPTDYKKDEVFVRAFSPGGFSLSSEDGHETAVNAAGLVAMGGVGEFDLVELQKKLAGKVVQVQPTIGETSEGFVAAAAPADLETMFQLVHLYFTSPRPDPEAMASFRTRVTASLANRSAAPAAAFLDTLAVTMAQHHPRAKPPSVEMLDALDLDEAVAFYRDRFADAGDFHFVFVGAFQPDSIRPLVERYLASLPTSGRVESFRDLGIDPPTGVIEKVVHKGVEPKAQTRFVFTGPFDYEPENRLAMRLLAGVLEIRLREVMREDLGGTYGVGVAGNYQKHPDAEYSFLVDFGSDPGRAEELSAIVLDEIRRLRAEGPAEDDVVKVKEQERRSRETRRQLNQWWVAQLAFAAEFGFDPRFLLDESMLEAVTAETVRQAAERWLRLDNYVMVRLLPEKPSS